MEIDQDYAGNSIKNRWNALISKRIITDSAGNRSLAPCKIRKYSKKNKMLEKARPEALDIISFSSPKQNENTSSNAPIFTEANIVFPQATESSTTTESSSGNNTPSCLQRSVLPSPFTLISPTSFDGQELPFSPFGGFNFPTTPDFFSPRGFSKFALQSPLFSPL